MDEMLGDLATWLRLLGFDAQYVQDMHDDEILLLLQDDPERVLVTRDKVLLQRAYRSGFKVYQAKGNDLDSDLASMKEDLCMECGEILSRCSLCNTPVTKAEQPAVRERVPESVAFRSEEFWFCPHCQKVYWTGSHTEEIYKKAQELGFY